MALPVPRLARLEGRWRGTLTTRASQGVCLRGEADSQPRGAWFDISLARVIGLSKPILHFDLCYPPLFSGEGRRAAQEGGIRNPMKDWQRLGALCTVLQVFGLVLIVWHESLPSYTPVLIGITGFAGIAKYFLIDPRTGGVLRRLYMAGAVCGGLVIVLACVLVATAG